MLDLEDNSTDAAVVAELAVLAEGNLPAQVVKLPDGRTFGIHRNDIVMSNLTPANAAEVFAPKTIALTTQLQTSFALAQYLHRFKDADSIMFADVAGNKITAILDYHVRPTSLSPEGAKPAQPRHSAHRAVLQLRHSQEWAVWAGQNEKLMKHVAFVEFLEANALDVQDPSSGSLIELCRDLQVKAGTHFKTSVRDGDYVNISFQKDNDVTTAGEVRLPAEMEIAIPVYFGELPISMRVLLRRKVDDGELLLGFKILRMENHKQDEFLRIANAISADTDVESVLGNP